MTTIHVLEVQRYNYKYFCFFGEFSKGEARRETVCQLPILYRETLVFGFVGHEGGGGGGQNFTMAGFRLSFRAPQIL